MIYDNKEQMQAAAKRGLERAREAFAKNDPLTKYAAACGAAIGALQDIAGEHWSVPCFTVENGEAKLNT